MLRACTECWKSISELNGFMMASGEEPGAGMMQLLHISETRHAMETEGLAIAPVRLFEAFASENHLNEPMATHIFELTARALQVREINLNALNLYLPFSPRSARVLQANTMLKREVTDFLSATPVSDPLIIMAITYGYILMQRSSVKYRFFNGGVIVGRWMFGHQLVQLPVLPFSSLIRQEMKEAEQFMEEAFETGAMQGWVLYFLSLLGRASRKRMEQMLTLLQLKRSTYDMIEKYTAYPLPASDLNELLFSKPFIKAADIIQRTACHRQTAHTYLHHLEKLGLLILKKSGREKLYMHKRLLDVLISD